MQQNVYNELAQKIISAQVTIVGPLAFDVAKRISGLSVEDSKNVMVEGDPKSVLGELVNNYATMFGEASLMVSKDAASSVAGVTSEQLPEALA